MATARTSLASPSSSARPGPWRIKKKRRRCEVAVKTPEEVAARLVSLQPKSCRQRSQAGSSREYLQAVGDGVEEAGRRSSNADPHVVEEVRDAGGACKGRAGGLGKPVKARQAETRSRLGLPARAGPARVARASACASNKRCSLHCARVPRAAPRANAAVAAVRGRADPSRQLPPQRVHLMPCGRQLRHAPPQLSQPPKDVGSEAGMAARHASRGGPPRISDR